MKRLLSLAVVVLALVVLSGCGKKEEADDLQPITMESLGAISTSVPAATEIKVQSSGAVVEAVTQVKEALPLPPQGPYKPTATEIQTALKQAGFYSGSIDGKIGPKSKKAIEDFQNANGLKVDGKVGPKTWEALGKYLITALEPAKR
ncbi:MAG: peptidoglycan-binding domain-containing protein [Candidatus Omnitrophica bacterium]|nr:peptidoglycan-binding domain-containing protein [Candidatus Omnitrophota bacterium]MDD5660610.1 peptidoglycan-binding domain-containing protein [Candidatus Omnitrophota bacterium]